MRNEA